jgi:epoxyqueuosine reductase
MIPSPLQKEDILSLLLSAKFDVVGCVSREHIQSIAPRLIPWLEAGFHGDMAWMAHNADKRSDIRVNMPETRSVFMVGLNYAPNYSPLDDLKMPHKGMISVYAKNIDYHDLMKSRLKKALEILKENGINGRLFVDTAPVHEKSLAQTAGLGWQGKHTNIVSRDYGSWLFLGALVLDVSYPSDTPEQNHCGRCTKCLDACPTNAFIAPYVLDARKCISYLTIEYKGIFPRDLAKKMGNYIYGCDICLSVCPWNKFAVQTKETDFHLLDATNNPSLEKLINMSEADFKTLFKKSPIKRIGYIRFMRNVINAMGNSSIQAYIPLLAPWQNHENLILRQTAIYALQDLHILDT